MCVCERETCNLYFPIYSRSHSTVEIYAVDASNSFIPADELLAFVLAVKDDDRLSRYGFDILVRIFFLYFSTCLPLCRPETLCMFPVVGCNIFGKTVYLFSY